MAIILLLLLTPSLAAADVFCDNVKAIATTLSKNAASSPVHFATKTFGGGPNVVFALGLCRGNVLDGPACGDCIANWFGKALNRTRCDKARSTYGDCIVVYSAGDDILAAPSNTTGAYGDNTPLFQQWNIKNLTTGDVPLVHELLVETAEKAATTTPRLYATGVMDIDEVTTYPKVYSQAQCTPDLSADDCLACLRRLLGMVNSTMSLRIGGQMAVMRCYFRYEAYLFYDARPMLSLPLPPLPTTPTKSGSMLWVVAVVVVPLTAAAFLFFFLNKGRVQKDPKLYLILQYRSTSESNRTHNKLKITKQSLKYAERTPKI
uniref:Gnk2-homologous domain-containing protein n=1 Tax=Triticum aestivum TaxID=4565 RepID=A0A077RPF4_WHEAT|nr:unnamed protein product [Triticum aestivum]